MRLSDQEGFSDAFRLEREALFGFNELVFSILSGAQAARPAKEEEIRTNEKAPTLLQTSLAGFPHYRLG